jgi:hypothetical protein
MEGKTCLLSNGAPDSPVHHRTATVHVLPYWAQPTVEPRDRLAWATRCPLIALVTVGLGDSDSPDSPMHHRTVR